MTQSYIPIIIFSIHKHCSLPPSLLLGIHQLLRLCVCHTSSMKVTHMCIYVEQMLNKLIPAKCTKSCNSLFEVKFIWISQCMSIDIVENFSGYYRNISRKFSWLDAPLYGREGLLPFLQAFSLVIRTDMDLL